MVLLQKIWLFTKSLKTFIIRVGKNLRYEVKVNIAHYPILLTVLNFKTASKVTQHNPRDVERKKHIKEHLIAQDKEATKYIETAGKIIGVEVDSIMLKGSPAEKIFDFADENNIDLIVVCSLGKSGIERFALESVSEKVERHAKVFPYLLSDGRKRKRES